jgi:cytidyltransferase-like protein
MSETATSLDPSILKNSSSERVATIGGTFDALHTGHKEYIKLSFEFADYVIIYVNSDEYDQRKRFNMKSYDKRVHALRDFIFKIGVDPTRYEFRKLSSRSQLEEDYLSEEIHFAIVVPEYYQLLRSMNELRTKNGKMQF